MQVSGQVTDFKGKTTSAGNQDKNGDFDVWHFGSITSSSNKYTIIIVPLSEEQMESVSMWWSSQVRSGNSPVYIVSPNPVAGPGTCLVNPTPSPSPSTAPP